MLRAGFSYFQATFVSDKEACCGGTEPSTVTNENYFIFQAHQKFTKTNTLTFCNSFHSGKNMSFSQQECFPVGCFSHALYNLSGEDL